MYVVLGTYGCTSSQLTASSTPSPSPASTQATTQTPPPLPAVMPVTGDGIATDLVPVFPPGNTDRSVNGVLAGGLVVAGVLVFVAVLTVVIAVVIVKRRSSNVNIHDDTKLYENTEIAKFNQQQHVELTQNQAYVTSASVSMQTNESYGTTTTFMDSDLLYATVEGEHSITQEPNKDEYDYVIPR